MGHVAPFRACWTAIAFSAICANARATWTLKAHVYAAIAATVVLGGLSVLFSILACVLDTDKDIGGNWYCIFPTLPFARWTACLHSPELPWRVFSPGGRCLWWPHGLSRRSLLSF